jgi:RNA 2',3'-cyclic 3'-phosphodiesterase
MSDLPPRIRAFVALRVSAAVEDAIARWIETLRDERQGIRWIKPGNLHLTLRFLGGAISRDIIPPLDDRLRQIATETRHFVIGARSAGAFPNLDRPRVVWVGLRSDELPRLAAQVEQAAVDAGLPPEPRSYSPHLTIGRVRDMRGWPLLRDALRQAGGLNFGESMIDRMILYRSILGGSGSRYVELASYRFSQPT